MNTRTALRWLAQAGFSLALLGGVILWIGPRDLLRTLGDADPRWLALAMLIFSAGTMVHGARWWILLRPIGRVPLHETVLVMLVAKAVGILIPLRAGAVLQVQLLGRRYEFNRAAVAGTLVLEAVLDAACFLVLFLLIGPLVGAGRYLTGGIWVMAVVVAAAVAIVVLLARRRSAHEPEGSGLGARVMRLFAAVQEGFAAIQSPTVVLLAATLTLTDWALATVGYAAIGRAFAFDLGLADYLLVEIVSNLAGAIPFTQAGIGPYEVAVGQLLSQRGIALETGSVYAVGAHAVILLAGLISGGVALVLLRLRPNEVLYLKKENGDAATDPTPGPSPAVRGRGA